MQVGWHNHIRIHPQIFEGDAKVEAIRDSLPSGFVDKYRSPFDNGEGHIVQYHACNDAVAFHAVIIPGRPSVNMLAQRRSPDYFDFLDRLASTACTEGLTALSVR